MDKPFLYRAALRGTFGEWIQFGRGGEIVSSASSFISLDREIEMDLFTAEAHRGKNLATGGMIRIPFSPLLPGGFEPVCIE